MNHVYNAVTAALVALTAAPCVAADASQLENVLITATRRAISADQALPPVIVIDREQIERSQVIDVAELLRYHAGIEIARNGGPGQVTSAFIRGSNSNHTLVLIDGVKVNPGTAGGAALQNITPPLIERIEIVKGPRSSLYGSEAIGGVVNIITRRSQAPSESSMHAQAGSYGLRGVGGHLARQGDNFAAGVSATSLRSDGFPTFRDDRLDRGFDNDAISTWLQARFGRLQLEASHWQAKGTTEYADFFRAPQAQDYTNQLSRLRALWQGHRWRSTLLLARVGDHIQQTRLAVNPNDFVRTERDVVDWQNDLDFFAGMEITAGLSVARERTSGQSFGLPLEAIPGSRRADRDEDAIYLQTAFAVGSNRFIAAGRHTDHANFGGVNTWNLEWGRPLGADVSVGAGIGRGFRAPSTSDLYAFGGNPALAPEISRSVDLGIKYRPSRHHELGLALFHTEINDLIEYFDPDGFMGELPGRNENIGDARIQGAELSWRAHLGLWRADAQLILQQPEDRNTGERLLRRADRIVTMQWHRRFGDHEAGIQLIASGERTDFGEARLTGYAVANLTTRFSLGSRWTVRARLENLLNRRYELVQGYNSPGRGLYASLAYKY